MRRLDNQKGFFKNTSLQEWSKLTEKYFNKKLRIEVRKDREQIYSLLKEMELPYEDFRAFKNPEKMMREEFEGSVEKLGYPYWISATPKLGNTKLNRLSKLRIESTDDGWNFIKSLPQLRDYKVIVMQYADDPVFKGSVLVSSKLNGVADFVLGDKHVQLIEGLTVSDPMLFNKQEIIRYSSLIKEEYQNELWSYTSAHPGHFEFQYGTINKKKSLSFFDYNDEPAYENIDQLHQKLIEHYSLKGVKDVNHIVKGLPASLGKACGICKIILNSDYTENINFPDGAVLITDVTSPLMTPLLKKCAAIVTDLGGVTSHAAIVCREMEIPCIVGTNNATRKLVNGMYVLIDANQGIVKFEQSPSK